MFYPILAAILTILSTLVAVVISFMAGGPGIVGVCGALIPLGCGIPVVAFLFSNSVFTQKFRGKPAFVLPAFAPLLFASLFIGLIMYDQNPHVMFRRLLSDPIPEGISNIQSYDNSGGLDVEYGLAFETTPETIDYIIEYNDLKLDTNESNGNRYDIPFEYFPNIDGNQDWTFYSRSDDLHEELWFLWVNADKTMALFKFIGW